MTPFAHSENLLSKTALIGILCVLAILMTAACAGSPKPSLNERLAAMSDTELVAYYQGVDHRLKAVGDEVRRETADEGAEQGGILYQQTYFLGGEGHRLLRERQAAERELLRRTIPRSRWAAGPED